MHFARRMVAVSVCTASLACGQAPATPFGRERQNRHVAFAVLEDSDKGADLDDVARDFDLLRELGVTSWRGSFGWDDFEPARGTYDFQWLHRFVALAGIARDWNVWNDPPRDPDVWATFVGALARAMARHPNVVSYEIHNEENVQQWWEGWPHAYADVLKRGAAAIRRANPEAEVLFGGMTFPDVEWLESSAHRPASRSST